ncbi:MAG TPA: thioredoxin [Vicinamibacteria bacterium]|nr:thioredoxin [Vicinamibacteria bacterium]
MGKYITATEENFKTEVLQSDKPVLVDFWADWCGPCKMIAPAIEELAEEFDGRAKIAKVNVDEHQALAIEYGVRSIPTLLFFRDGKVVEQLVGAAPKGALAEKLNGLVKVAS